MNMSYDPSHRMPPRQERWPTATPAEGWPSYRNGEQEDLRYEAQGAAADYRQQAVATTAYPVVTNGYDADGYRTGGYPGGYDWSGNGYAGTADGYTGTADGYAGAADDFDGGQDGYTGAGDGHNWPDAAYAGDADGHDWSGNGHDWGGNGHDWGENGYGGTAHGYADTADGYAGGAYLGPGSYVEPGAVLTDGPVLAAPDAGVYPDRWQAEREYRREAGRRGPMVGAVTELLAIGMVIGVSTLAAALLKSATSPVSAMGAVFIERTPAALRIAVMHHFGTQGRTVLLLGMYVTFAVVAIVIGMMARRYAGAAVAGVAAFTLFAAFVVITRPAGHVADAVPAVIGGMAGAAAVLWLFRASAPQMAQGPFRHGHGGTRRRTR